MPQLETAVIVMQNAINVLLTKPKEGVDAGLWVIPSGIINEFEPTMNACERIILEQTNLIVIPKQVLFLSEIVLPPVDRRAVFCFAECTSLNDLKPNETLIEARFVDPRVLGDYQKEGMSLLTEDAFFKFSKVLQAQAAAQPKSGNLSYNPQP